MRKIFLTLTVFAFFISAVQVGAVKLKAIEALSIKEANVSYDAQNRTLNGIAKILNPYNEEKSYRLFLSFISEEGAKEFTRFKVSDNKKAKARGLSKEIFALKDLRLPNGSYEIRLLLDSTGIGISSVKSLGSIKISDSSEKAISYNISCSANNKSADKEYQVPIVCKIDPALKEGENARIEYSIQSVGEFAAEVRDSFTLPGDIKDSIEFTVPAKNINGGTVDVSVKLLTDDGVSNLSYFRYFMPGKYSRVVFVKNNPAKRVLDLYLNGSLYLKDRRAAIGLLSLDKICFYKDEDLYSINPLRREVSYKESASLCGKGAKAFAIIYKSKSQDDPFGAEDILDFKGLQDKESALAILNTIYKKDFNVFNKLGEIGIPPILIFVALIFIFVLILLALYFIARKRLGLFAIILALSVTPGFAGAEIFDSLDAPKVRFEVNFPNITKEVGQNDDIVFSFSAINNFTGGIEKYPGAEVYAWLDSDTANKVKIMDAADNKPTVVVQLPNNLSLGVHTVNFEVPASTGICGAAYDFSDFDQAVFDPVPCEFSVDFTVVPGSKISLTFYAQPKAVPIGGTSKLYWASAGADSCIASDGWSGNRALINMVGESTDPINTSFQDYTLTCSNASESVTQTDTVYTYVCGDNICSQWEDCNLCSQDCGDCGSGGGTLELSISADPQLVREGGVSYITWYSKGYTNCSVSEDNPSINDSWRRLAGVEKTSSINTDTVYTLTCDVNGADSASKSVKVRMIPKFIEF